MPSEVKVKVGLESGAVGTGLTKIKAQFAGFRNDVTSQLAGLFTAGAITAGANELIKKGAEIANIARRLGVGVEDLQRVKNAAEEEGASLENVAAAFNKLTINQHKAIDGSDEARKGFADLGISMKDVANLPVDQLFFRVADAVAGASDRSQAYAAVVSILGRNAGQLFTTLEKGSAAIKAQGGILSAESVEQLREIDIELKNLKDSTYVFGGETVVFLNKIFGTIGVIFGEILHHAADSLTAIGEAFQQAKQGHFIEAGKRLGTALSEGVKSAIDLTGVGAAFDPLTRKDVADIWKRPAPAAAQPAGKGKKGPFDPEASDKEKAAAEKIASLNERLADIQRQAGNDQLGTEAKINALIAQRAQLIRDAEKAHDAGAEEKSLEAYIKAAALDKEIFDTQKQMDALSAQKGQQQAPSVVADPLRRQFGGGFAGVSGIDLNLREQKTHTKLLEEIQKNTAAKTELDLKMR